MDKFNKIPIILTSFMLIGLISCTSSDKNSIPDSITQNEIYTGNRTINKNHKISVLNDYNYETIGRYDYTDGVYMYPPIGYFEESNSSHSDIVENLDNKSDQINTEEILFTIEEVQQITNDIYTQYDEALSSNSKEYENYINALSDSYMNLENEYISLLQDISYLAEYPEDNVIDTPTENEKEAEDKIDNQLQDKESSEIIDNPEYTHEQKLDILYQEALKNASENLDEFKPIQGQIPDEDNKTDQEKVQNIDNSNSSSQNYDTQDTLEINSKNIFKIISENLILPSYTEKDIDFLISNYGFEKNKLNDFKLVTSNTPETFEMLILNASKLSDEDLINCIEFRINSILSEISENNNNDSNLDEKVLLINIDEYILFCFSDINNDLLNFLQNI